ncbi:hypothetical protein AAFF_G00222970 [Aldrovandia affinis]|uniref:Uncharacterized protein n=1 Tax=Aldrovandia affinis TaxID=143900 RepID=A0AAD7RFY5_9TELE|nr:hypothetical protein AAFF_G00222970 [Aldrovandia affinis]
MYQEDHQFMKQVSKSAHLINGHYCISLPLRKEKVNIPNNHSTAEHLLKLMTSVEPKLNHMAGGLNLNPGLKSKEIEEAMKRVREAQSLISAAIEPGNKKDDN